MKKVKTNIRITAADTISDTLVRLYKTAVESEPDGTLAKDSVLAAIIAELESLSALLTTAINRDKILTSLEDADTTRDTLISELFKLIAGYSVIPVAAKQQAAQKLLAVTAKYTGITSSRYAEESSLIESLLEELTALSDQSAQLEGVDELIASLRSAQDAFNTASDAATSAQTSRTDSAYALKKQLIAFINTRLVPYMNAVAPLDAYADIAAKYEKEIDNINELATTKTSSSDDSSSATTTTTEA